MEDQIQIDDYEGSLQWLDWIILCIMLTISALIGVYYRFTGGKQKTSEEYFSADRSTPYVMLAIAMMVSFFTGSSMLGCSSETYVYGAKFNFSYIGLILATPIVAYIYLPVFYELKTMSIFEYLEKRFGMSVRLIASAGNFLQYSFFTGIVIYAPSLALEATTGLSSTSCVLLIGGICTFYSTIGGLKAVIRTDLLQGALMFASMLCIIGLIHARLDNGLWSVLEMAEKGGRMNILEFDFDPTVRYGFISALSATCIWLSQFATNQVQVQRMLSTKSIKEARKGIFLNIPVSLGLSTLMSYSGLALYAYYGNCDPVKTKKIKSYDMLLALFAKEQMTKIPGLTGIFVSGIFSASLSTVSALLNSLAAVALSDYLLPLCKKFGHNIPDERVTTYGKLISLCIGGLSLVVAFFASKIGGLIQAFVSIHGAIGGPMLGLFTLGMFFETANETGAVVGIIGALIVNIFYVFSPKARYPPLSLSIEGCRNFTLTNTSAIPTTSFDSYSYIHRLSFLWFSMIGMCCTILFGLTASIVSNILSNKKPPIVDLKLFTPIIAARIRRKREKLSQGNSQVFVLNSKTIECPQ